MNKLDLEETTRKFHNIYEQVAKEYGYKTREDTKELDFNSPNGMTMLKTVEVMTTPYLEEIERLKTDKEQLNSLVNFNQKEIRILNNIINGFDKWLDEESEKTILSTGHLTCLIMCKNKLQELKGSLSNE